MRLQEAQWIGATIQAHALPLLRQTPGAVVLNLGSGTRKAREVSKPHIQQLTLDPLIGAGARVVHADLLQGDGIDISGDMFDAAHAARLAELRPALVYFCNIMEHLQRDLLGRVPAVLDSITPPGGLLLLSVPNSYPYHADPIDNMYRPTLDEVCALLPGWQVLARDLVDSSNYGEEFRRGSMGKRVRKVLRLLFPFVRPRRWLSHAHRFFWLSRPYRHAIVLLRKPG